MGVLLFFSGACALTYQVIWLRELKLVFGATTHASAVVLAVFMGGVGAGNLYFGHRTDASRAPIRYYASLELAIALWVATTPWLIGLVASTYIELGGQATLGARVAQLARMAGTFVVLFGPTFLMGGTIPAAAKAVSSVDDPLRLRLALVYGLNTIGAVAGAFLSAFYFLELLGNRSLLGLAVLINVFIAMLALGYSRWLITPRNASKSSSFEYRPNGIGNGQLSGVASESPKIALLCITSALVGFVFFLMELVWYRMLGPLLGGTTYTFGTILCSALLGIGVGGAAYGLLGNKFRPTLGLLAITCCCEALALILPYFAGDSVAIYVLHQQTVPAHGFSEQIWRWLVPELGVDV